MVVALALSGALLPSAPANAALTCNGHAAIEAGDGFEGTSGRDVVVITEASFVGNTEVRLGDGDDIACVVAAFGIDLRLGAGNDQVFARPSPMVPMTNVSIRGGSGNDEFHVFPGIRVPNPLLVDIPGLPDIGDKPRFIGGPGIDWVNFNGFSCGLNVDLDVYTGHALLRAPVTCRPWQGLQGSELLGPFTGAELLGFERATGTSKDDEIIGNGGANWLFGGSGGDRLLGKGGDDFLQGGPDDDQLWGHSGNDTLTGAAGNDRLYTGSGNDTVAGYGGDDLIEPGNGINAIHGGQGWDTVRFPVSSTQPVTVDLDSATYTRGSLSSGQIFAEEVYGTDKADTLRGSMSRDKLHGLGGNDVIQGRAGNDEIYGDAGADEIYGGKGADRIRGGDGDDYIHGRSGDDWLSGNAGYDHLEGGTGSDFCESFEEATTCEDGLHHPPVVDIVTASNTVYGCLKNVYATVTDRDLELFPVVERLTYQWSLVSSTSSGSVTFSDADREDTSVEFSKDGTYTLRLRVEDNWNLYDADTVSFDVVNCAFGGPF